MRDNWGLPVFPLLFRSLHLPHRAPEGDKNSSPQCQEVPADRVMGPSSSMGPGGRGHLGDCKSPRIACCDPGLWGQSHAPPRRVTRLPPHLHYPEGGSSRVQSEFWGVVPVQGGAAFLQHCPSIKAICVQETPPTWGWGQGLPQTQHHSESRTDAPVCAQAEVPQEAWSGPRC